MIARFHYDDAVLDRLRLDQLGEDETEIQGHVETCAACQQKLDTLSQGDMTWEEVGALLGGNPMAELAKNIGDTESEPKTLVASAATFLKSSDDPDSIGRFARYEVREIIGRGGMGIVMRAFDPSLGRYCAVKVLAPELAGSAAAKKRFSREAKSAAAVVHPHVVPIQTVDEQEGLPYLVMPLVEGQSLQQRVESIGPLPMIEAVRIAAQVAEGLAAAHDQGLVHRDIKPANILLDNGVERVQITDFGLARAVDDASMTRSGVIAGTPQYMSPEQAHGDAIDHRSDLFSLGSVIYFMLTGRSPFRAETTMGVLNRIGNDEPRPLRSINVDVPSWLAAIVSRLLSKQPYDRFDSAEEVAKLLQSWHAHLQSPDTVRAPAGNEATSLSAPVSSRRLLPKSIDKLPPIPWFVALAAFAFFASLGTVIYLKTNTGTLRIETNSNVEIPVRITQNDETIGELTVTSAGATKQLKAGQYTIEIEDPDSKLSIIGDEVQIRRGDTTVATIGGTDQVAVSKDLTAKHFPSPQAVIRHWIAAQKTNDYAMAAEALSEVYVAQSVLDAFESLAKYDLTQPRSKWDEGQRNVASILESHLPNQRSQIGWNEFLELLARYSRSLEVDGVADQDKAIKEALLSYIRMPRRFLIELSQEDSTNEISRYDGPPIQYRLFRPAEDAAVAVQKDGSEFLLLRPVGPENGWLITQQVNAKKHGTSDPKQIQWPPGFPDASEDPGSLIDSQTTKESEIDDRVSAVEAEIIEVSETGIVLSAGYDDGLKPGQRVFGLVSGSVAEIERLGTDKACASILVHDPDAPFKVGNTVVTGSWDAAINSKQKTNQTKDHPLYQKLQGKWIAHFSPDAKSEDDAEIMVANDILIWTDADGDQRRYLMTLKATEPFALIELRDLHTNFAVSPRIGIIRSDNSQIEICYVLNQWGHIPKAFANTEKTAVVILRRPGKNDGAKSRTENGSSQLSSNPLVVAKSYYEHLRRGQFEKSKRLIAGDKFARLFNRGWFNQVSALVRDNDALPRGDPQIRVTDDRALAVFPEIQFSPALPDVGAVGRMVLQLEKRDKKWTIGDVDIWSDKDARHALRRQRSDTAFGELDPTVPESRSEARFKTLESNKNLLPKDGSFSVRLKGSDESYWSHNFDKVPEKYRSWQKFPATLRVAPNTPDRQFIVRDSSGSHVSCSLRALRPNDLSVWASVTDFDLEKIGFTISGKDCEAAELSGKYSKVVYLVDGEKNVFETLTSNGQQSLDELVDEANRRGEAIVSLTLIPFLKPIEANDHTGFIDATPGSFLTMLDDYNSDTRDDRTNKFDPAIEDLTLRQLLDALQASAKRYRKRGLHNVADALEASASQKRFTGGLEYMGGVTGTFYRSKDNGEVTFRQYLPSLILDDGSRTGLAVYLTDLELRYSRDGWSSSTWGDLHPVLDGEWELTEVGKSGRESTGEKLEKWKASHPWWSSMTIKNNRVMILTGVDRPNKFWFELSYEDAIPKIDLQFDASSRDVDDRLFGVFTTNASIDFTELTLVVDTDERVDSFRTKGTYRTKLKFKRVDKDDAVIDEATSSEP